jgi:hypothetical protein
MSDHKTVGGWLRAIPSPARPELRAKIDSGVTTDSPSPFAGLAGIRQRPTVIESVRLSNRFWHESDRRAV